MYLDGLLLARLVAEPIEHNRSSSHLTSAFLGSTTIWKVPLSRSISASAAEAASGHGLGTGVMVRPGAATIDDFTLASNSPNDTKSCQSAEADHPRNADWSKAALITFNPMQGYASE
jgi:hypothetical protein